MRSNVNELAELVATHTVWCVNSLVSGDFSQAKYGRLMSVVDMLIEFIFTPKKEDHADNDEDMDRSMNELHDLHDSRERKLSGDLEPLPLPVESPTLAPSASRWRVPKKRRSSIVSKLLLDSRYPHQQLSMQLRSTSVSTLSTAPLMNFGAWRSSQKWAALVPQTICLIVSTKT